MAKGEVLLLILRVLMERTNRTESLTEKEMEDILYDEYQTSIERKQFYRCIDKLIEADYPIIKVKGSVARYYYDGLTHRVSDSIYLSHLINNAEDISVNEKELLMQRLELNPFADDRWSYNPFIELMELKKTSINYHPLDNFYYIYVAYKNNYKIEYKIYKDGVISDCLVNYVDSIDLSDKKIKISINNSKFFLNEIINVKILK